MSERLLLLLLAQRPSNSRSVVFRHIDGRGKSPCILVQVCGRQVCAGHHGTSNKVAFIWMHDRRQVQVELVKPERHETSLVFSAPNI